MNQFLNAAGRRAALAVATLMLAANAVAGAPAGEPALAIRPPGSSQASRVPTAATNQGMSVARKPAAERTRRGHGSRHRR